jgi:hypothetical protein
MKRLLPLLFALLFAAAAQAAAPVIRDLSPRGAQRGKTFTLYLKGEGLARGAQIRSTLPATFSKLTRSANPFAGSNTGGLMRPDSVLPLLVSLAPNAPTGIYPIRVVTPEGISNVVLFPVGELAEIEETESNDPKQVNDSPEQAQRVQTGAVINGTLAGAETDNFTFRATAGQKLVFEVEARRLGSAIDPAIQIFDSSGREIARNDDAEGLGVDSRVEVTFPKAGDYRVHIHDSKFSDQTQNFYRLKIGSYAFASGVFPLGWRRGETAEVTLFGGNLPAPVKVTADFRSKSEFVPVRVPSSPALPFLLAVSDLAETVEPGQADGPVPLAASTVMNGRISKPGEIDRYKLRVEPGEKWVFEIAAVSLGTSPLDAILTLYDAAGKKLATGDDGNGVDPVLPFTVPEGTRELILAVEDLLGRGGPHYGYRLQAARQHSDFSVELATPFVNVPAGGTAQVVVAVQRRGYTGALKLSIPGLPEGFTAAGGHVPPESAAQRFTADNTGRTRERSVITITARPDVKPQSLDLSVAGEALMPDGTSIRRMARGPGMLVAVRGVKEKTFSAPWLEMQLPMAVSPPPSVTVASSTPLVRIAQGFEYVLDYKVSKPPAAGPVRVTQQTAGAVGNLRILKGAAARGDNGSFLVSTNFATPTTTFDMLLEAQTEIAGSAATVPSSIITFEVVPGYEIRLARADVEIAPGREARVEGSVRRELTFEGGEIRIRIEDLPDGVACAEATVPAGGTAFGIACNAAASAKPGAFDVRLASSAPDTGRKQKAEYKIPDVHMKLVVNR